MSYRGNGHKQLKIKIMTEFRITVPQGYEIDKEKSTFELIKFKPIEKKLPKTWEELGDVSGYNIRDISEIAFCGSCKTKHYNKNIFPTRELAEAALALAQLLQLRDRYNDGWVPDWGTEHHKDCIVIRQNNIELHSFYGVSHVLSFKNKELAYEFLTNFRDLIEIAKPLL